MADNEKTPGHHGSAAYHHRQAAHYHREASRHYQIGKDYVHAAHLALTAHGHAMEAMWNGNENPEQNESRRAFAPDSAIPVFGSEIVETPRIEIAPNSAAQHTAAADGHEQAARHHSHAAALHDGNEHVKAAYEASIAHGYARQALFHGDEAARHAVEHYGKSGPTAEIS